MTQLWTYTRSTHPELALLLILLGACAHAPAASNDPSRLGSVSGFVVDRDGVPVGYGVVRVIGVTGALSDATGHFTITNVPAGSHSIDTKSVGFLATTIEGVEVQAGKTTQIGLVVDWNGSRAHPIDVKGLPPAPPRTLFDPKRTGVLTGTVVDEEGVVIDSASIVLDDVLIGGRTDSRGHFRIPGLKPDRYTLTLRRAGFVAGQQRKVRVNAGQTTVVNVQLERKTAAAAP